MIRRVVLAVATALLATVALCMGVAATLAQESGVSLRSSPRWGPGVVGTWTPYSIELRNDGPGDVTGEVFLIPEPDPPPTKPLAGPRPEPVPTWPTYRTAAFVAAGSQRSFTTMVLEAPGGYRSELRDGEGRVVASATTETRPAALNRRFRGPEPTIALLSQVAGTDSIVANAQAGTRAKVVRLAAPRDVPENILGFNRLDAIMVGEFDSAGLTPSQRQALDDYVSLGGRLVLLGGAPTVRTLAALPEAIVPLLATGSATASLAPITDLAAFTTTAEAPIVTGNLRPGARSPLGPAGSVPLVVEADHGDGRIVQLAYDPFGEPFASDRRLAAIAWEQGLGRAVGGTGGTSATVDFLPALDGGVRGAMFSTSPASPWPRWQWWQSALLAGYVVMVGVALVAPAVGARRRFGERFRRQRFGWGVVTAALTFGVLVSGVAVEPARAAKLVGQVVRVEVGGPYRPTIATELRGMTPGSGEETPAVALPSGSAASTVLGPPQEVVHMNNSTPEWSASAGVGGGEVIAGAVDEVRFDPPSRSTGAQTVPTLAGEHGVVAAGDVDSTVPDPSAVSAASTRRSTAHILSAGPRQGGIEGDLRQVGTGPDEVRGRVTGTLTNHSGRRLRHLLALLPGQRMALLADVIEPGQTVVVDAAVFDDNDASNGRPPSESEPAKEVRAAAARSYSFNNRVPVSGLSDPREGATYDVLVSPVSFAAPPAAISGQLVSAARHPDDWVDVYEVALPSAIGSWLAFNRNRALEIFDWPTQTWRPVPASESTVKVIPVALLPGETVTGTVRIRVHEEEPNQSPPILEPAPIP